MDLKVEQALQTAVEAHRAGRLEEAERLYRAILAVQPAHSDANHNLGVLAVAVGQPQAGLPHLRTALESDLRQGQYWVSYLDALLVAGRAEDAGQVLAEGRKAGLSGAPVDQLEHRIVKALGRTPEVGSDAARDTSLTEPSQQRLETLVQCYGAGDLPRAEAMASDLALSFPNHPLAWMVLGAIGQQQGRLEEALAYKLKSVELSPQDAAAHANLAVTLNHLGRHLEAETACLEAIRLDPHAAKVRQTLGAALKAMGRWSAAEDAFRAAIALSPDYGEAHNSLGAALYEQGRHEAAEASYRETIRLQPDHAEAHNNLGVALFALGRLPEAEVVYRQAIALRPDYAEAHNNLGVTLNDLGRISEAVVSYRNAIQLGQNGAAAHSNLAGTLNDLGQISEARALHREALRLNPHFAAAHSNLLFGLNYIESLSPDEALAEARAYGAKVSAAATPKFSAWRVDPKPARLRVGFVSGDLKNHPVGYFLEGLVKALDPERFELIAFPTQRHEDALTDRIRPAFTRWIPLSGHPDAEAAAKIHAEGVHVLVDLSGHTAHNRLPVFAYRPAPIQVSWLGYFATTGLPEMDFFLGDPHMAPPGEEGHFSERVWRLPETWLCLTPPEPPIAIAPPPVLAQGAVTFGCFGNFAKLNDSVIDAWAAILRRTPGSQLFLKSNPFADQQVVATVRCWFEDRQVDPDRLILEGYTSRTAYFEAYGRVDMVLDTFPYPGGTTSVDALWMGTPVLTRKGGRFLSHLGESIAINAGQSDWIATDTADYVDRAVAFASDVQGLAKLRETLRPRILETPLFDAPRFARHFGDALWGMWAARKVDGTA